MSALIRAASKWSPTVGFIDWSKIRWQTASMRQKPGRSWVIHLLKDTKRNKAGYLIRGNTGRGQFKPREYLSLLQPGMCGRNQNKAHELDGKDNHWHIHLKIKIIKEEKIKPGDERVSGKHYSNVGGNRASSLIYFHQPAQDTALLDFMNSKTSQELSQIPFLCNWKSNVFLQP